MCGKEEKIDDLEKYNHLIHEAVLYVSFYRIFETYGDESS